jgi:hypothetical protein
MKKHLINITSGVFNALLIAGVLFFLASKPAQASDKDLIIGIILGTIISDISKDRDTHHTQGVIVEPTNPYNNPRRVGYARGLDRPDQVCQIITERHYNYILNIHQNCYGQTLHVERIPTL